MKRKKKRGKCIVRFCRNITKRRSRRCCKHIKRAERAADPIRARYWIVKDRARRKKIAFTITLAEFRALAVKAGFLTTPGVHLDREDATEGYHLWNVKFMLGDENIAKGNRERRCPRYQAYLAKKQAAEALASRWAEDWVDDSIFFAAP